MKASLSVSVAVTQMASNRDDTSEFAFSSGQAYILDPGTEFYFLKGSPLSIYENRQGPKLGITIEEVGALEEIEGRLSYQNNARSGALEFEFHRTLDDGTTAVQPAGTVPAGTTEVKLNFNAGFSDGVVIVGTVDVGSDGKSLKKK